MMKTELTDPIEPMIDANHGYGSQSLINLVLTGRAVGNVWDRDQNIGGLNLKGIDKTFGSMQFNWKRWILKEHTTQFIWLIGITLLLLLNYPELTGNDKAFRNLLLGVCLGVLTLIYILIRYLKKTGKFKE